MSARRAVIPAGLAGLFDALVDGVDADRLGLVGKPDPAPFLEAADRPDAEVQLRAHGADVVFPGLTAVVERVCGEVL
ncbi:hypothetical protein [Streptomyces sp. NBC_01343]|uniref:hypothetical protein n=1 Tax=Streptomyces sp. NBC_01343 TaxID=2903832 RepID=UPI003FA3724E